MHMAYASYIYIQAFVIQYEITHATSLFRKHNAILNMIRTWSEKQQNLDWREFFKTWFEPLHSGWTVFSHWKLSPCPELTWTCLFWCLTPEIWLETSLVFIHYEFVIHLPFNICSDTRALSRVLINTIVFIALIRQVRPADDFHSAQSMPAANLLGT